MDIKEKYKKLEKKYKLPCFDDINNEFEISIIEKQDFLLREIRRKITEKIEIYINLLEKILHPEAIVSDMYECKAITDEEKEAVFNLYRKLLFFNRSSIETSINEDDKKTSEFINVLWKEWPEIKKKFIVFVKKLKQSWLKETDAKTELGYLG